MDYTPYFLACLTAIAFFYYLKATGEIMSFIADREGPRWHRIIGVLLAWTWPVIIFITFIRKAVKP